MANAKILIIANDEGTILNFRKEVVKAFVNEKFNVEVCYPLGENSDQLEALGCTVSNLNVSRHGKNIIKDFIFFMECKKQIKRIKPDIVLTYTVKPNIYGSIACQMLNVPYINNVTGLGSILQKKGFLSLLILFLQKMAYKKSSCVFFQNKDNYEKLFEYKVIKSQTPVVILPGSGVNLQLMKFEEFPKDDGIVRFIIVSRIRADKGYKEFLDMAELIKKDNPNTEFHIVGDYEECDFIQRINELSTNNIVIYHGKKSQIEVHELITKSNCLILPSYHEGMANVLLEAASTGRPVIASNVPGCKETFEEGITGIGCNAKDSGDLVNAVKKFLDIPYEKQIEMGQHGRQKMEMEFDRQLVVDQYIKQIRRIVR